MKSNESITQIDSEEKQKSTLLGPNFPSAKFKDLNYLTKKRKIQQQVKSEGKNRT